MLNKLLVISFILLLSLLSCRGVDNGIERVDSSTGQVANVEFKVTGWEYEVDKNIQDGLKSYAGNEKQSKVVRFSRDIDMSVEVKPEPVFKNNLQASDPKKLSAANVVEKLSAGVYYRIIAYEKSTQNYVSYQDYITGSEDKAATMVLDAAKEYIFVAYSYGLNTQFPAPPPTENLGTAFLTIRDLDFNNKRLFFRKDDVGLLSKNNTINIVFQTNVSIITLILNSTVGNITEITQAEWRSNYFNGNFRLSDGTSFQITGADNLPTPITFPNINTNSIVSNPFLVHSSLSRSDWPKFDKLGYTTSLDIGSMTIAGVTKKNFSIGGLKTKPGYKYSVTINLRPTTQGNIIPGTTDVEWLSGDETLNFNWE